MNNNNIKIESIIIENIDTVWRKYNEPVHIIHWYFASNDWLCPKAQNDFKEGGRLIISMAAKDGSFAFDYSGTYDQIVEHKLVQYTLDDNRAVIIEFSYDAPFTTVKINFEPVDNQPMELQKNGWQAILDNFKNYVENISQ